MPSVKLDTNPNAKKRASHRAQVNRIIEQLPAFPLKKVKIGERAREDMKDIEGLASTIQEHGVIQPIIIDQDDNLIAGGRRCAASKHLKLRTIPATRVEISNSALSLELELLENIQRADMSWFEQATSYYRIFEAKKQVDPKWSQNKQALFLGRSQSDIQRYIDAYLYCEAMPELRKCKTLGQVSQLAQKMAHQALVNQQIKKLQADQEAALGEELDEEDLEEYQGSDVENVAALFAGTPGEAPDKEEVTNPHADPEWLKQVAERNNKAAQEARAKRRAVNPRLFDLEEAYKIGDAILELNSNPGYNDAFHFAEVDPPYAINLAEKRAKSENADNDSYNEIPVEKYPEFLRRSVAAVYKALAPNSYCVWWFGEDWRGLVRQTLTDAKFSVNPIASVWYKGAVGQTNSPSTTLGNSYESFFVARKGQPILSKPGRSNVFHFAGAHGSKRWHPTQRPAELIAELYATFAPKECHILIPFMGSGQSALVALDQGHKPRGWDTNREYLARYISEGLELFEARRGGDTTGTEEPGEKPSSETVQPS